MRGLAGFIMRGRLQAASIAMLGYFLPFLTPVVVALVTLKRGATEGTLMLLLSLMPALLWLVAGEATSLFVWLTLAVLVVVYIPAVILRVSVSWPLTLFSLIISCILAGVILANVFVDMGVDEIAATLQLEQVEQSQRAAIEQQLAVILQDYTALVGWASYLLALNTVISLFMGRWMQAALYNPGGFGNEFRLLRLHRILASVCFVAGVCGGVYCYTQNKLLLGWFYLLALPLILVALSVVHSAVKEGRLAVHWLVFSYITVLTVPPVVMLMGFLDTWLNFRGRLTKK
jgi:hypothetical protein